MVFISHLDLLRLLGRAARRAGLSVSLTQGFSPHLKIKLKKALKLGIASEHEEGEIVLNDKMEASALLEKWQRQLPSGLELKRVRLDEEILKEVRK